MYRYHDILIPVIISMPNSLSYSYKNYFLLEEYIVIMRTDIETLPLMPSTRPTSA